MSKTLIVIAGPTAAGKTSLAIQVAKHFKTEIISADSRQFYREMSIGTAKPSKEELAAVRHHLIDSHSILDSFSVGDFEKAVINLLEKLFKTHNQVVLVGGSGLFINAVCNGFDELPVASEETRNALNQILAEKGIEHLREKLKKVDPVYYSEVDIHNPQRLIRALEVYESTGNPFSSYRTKTAKQRDFNIIKLAISQNRGKLYEQINLRVDQMVENGLIEEVEGLNDYRHLNALNTVGYSEIFEYFDGKLSKEEAIDKIKQNTRRFAKRQLTWFKKSEDIKWFDPREYDSILNYLDAETSSLRSGDQKN
ncbi:tRNA (adenosine(37)-N6)-dimethylallyltransferase MiaA [Daejeonella sp.]|uniref:tRNA (adenosine(37)-N6)-dimethylallyltransferase MiaA n=1 Tax=Daejeonella sp. TaxID=2805397 RepID=UPI00272912E1|nr:tRNA (adenosine(37)-N6)-dimethylallyltransferase MiaA [Daejeonella sp.]MDO8993939.1 tRNA (adenosine(37)-N6)-dimethylallyltransferase MiaA [Daejeonella sp.]MDP2414874.1 tRNA (adenosine(37)-N6)-dimethylallyltransferase MiaA [Daejeonella sp.]